MRKTWKLTAAAFIMIASLVAAAEHAPSKPGEKDQCPVCGMFVAHYPDFQARIVFKDGSCAWFCGVKDMMKYYFGLPEYNPSRKTSDVESILVTDFSNLTPTDGYKAFYVLGSVVFGPMGQEFFPFAEESAAREFLLENNGKEIVRIEQVNPETLKELLRKY